MINRYNSNNINYSKKKNKKIISKNKSNLNK